MCRGFSPSEIQISMAVPPPLASGMHSEIEKKQNADHAISCRASPGGRR
jgi:hypothetical protein